MQTQFRLTQIEKGKDMQEELLNKLRQVTEEERLILQGASQIQSNLYTTQFAKPSDFTIDSKKLLEKGCLIEVRPHTRFVHFPRHRHNYVELIYMCSGTTTHILNGTDKLVLQEGDLLFLNQNASHEILPAGENDIAVNFIILPEFFDYGLKMMETDAASEQQKFIIQVLSYVEEHYKSGELTELAEELRFDIYWLSKEIRKRTGKTYTDLVQAKRLSQAAYLLRTTAMNVMDISMAVGYDNISYFHRIFQKKYGMTPRRYRISE